MALERARDEVLHVRRNGLIVHARVQPAQRSFVANAARHRGAPSTAACSRRTSSALRATAATTHRRRFLSSRPVLFSADSAFLLSLCRPRDAAHRQLLLIIFLVILLLLLQDLFLFAHILRLLLIIILCIAHVLVASVVALSPLFVGHFLVGSHNLQHSSTGPRASPPVSRNRVRRTLALASISSLFLFVILFCLVVEARTRSRKSTGSRAHSASASARSALVFCIFLAILLFVTHIFLILTRREGAQRRRRGGRRHRIAMTVMGN
jgi:hypothetical protein